MLTDPLKPIPEVTIVAPNMPITVWLTQPNYNGWLSGSTKHRPNFTPAVNRTCWLALMVTHDKVSAQLDSVARTCAALILDDGIVADELPFGLRFCHRHLTQPNMYAAESMRAIQLCSIGSPPKQVNSSATAWQGLRVPCAPEIIAHHTSPNPPGRLKPRGHPASAGFLLLLATTFRWWDWG